VAVLAAEGRGREGGPVDGPPSRSPARRDLVVAGVAVLLGLVQLSAGGGEPAPETSQGRGVATALLAVAMGAPLAWRRTRPGQAAAVVVVAAIGYAVALGPVPPYALWLALYAVVVHADGRQQVGAAALTAVGTAVAVVLGPVLHDRGDGGVLPTLLLTLVVGLAGALVRTERGRLDALRQRAASLERERDAAAREAAVEERLRIARDLHDLVGHGLSSLAVQSSTARLLLQKGDPTAATERLVAVEESSRAAMREMRQLLDVLRDDAARAPAPGLDDLARLVESARGDGLDATLDADAGQAVPADVGLAAYRIVQECLTNVRKHAAGAQVAVSLRRADDVLEVEVADHGGQGSTASGEKGHGLLGIRERVAALGGTVTAGPCDRGWRVVARLPLQGGQA
jgi:signal transduction histidine kinase